MITHGDDVEIYALRTQGWSISAIARHLGLGPQDGARPSGRRARGGRCARSRVARIPSTRWRTMCASGWLRTPMCGRRCCSQRRSGWAMGRRIRRSCAASATGGCDLNVRRARRSGPTPTSSTRPVRRSSGTGWSCARPRGVRGPSCWSGRCRTQAGCGAGSRNRWTRPIWTRASTRRCHGWAAPPGAGEPTAWSQWWRRAPTASRRRSRRWPSTTAPQSMCARRVGPAARARSRRASTISPSRGGAPLRSARLRLLRSQLTAGAPRSPTCVLAASMVL